jgi:hypothetical protein
MSLLGDDFRLAGWDLRTGSLTVKGGFNPFVYLGVYLGVYHGVARRAGSSRGIFVWALRASVIRTCLLLGVNIFLTRITEAPVSKPRWLGPLLLDQSSIGPLL